MPKFFSDKRSGVFFHLEGEDARHISRVLRMQPGEDIIVCSDRTDYPCKLAEISDSLVTALAGTGVPNMSEPTVDVTLYQALAKGDKFDFIVQKAVELGVTRIVPVLTERCVSRPDPKSLKKKRLRWQKIAKGAAEQSGRGIIPEVDEMVLYPDIFQEFSGTILFCYECGGERLGSLVPEHCQKIGLVIGPEGGFTAEEAGLAEKQGAAIATLGPRILRCETAPLCALSVIMNSTGNI